MDLRVCFGAINLVVQNRKEHKDLKLKQESTGIESQYN